MNKPNNKVSYERLTELLNYDPLTGIFTWRIGRRARGCVVGQAVGSDNGEGYLRVQIDGVRYKLHRLAFFYMKKRWPDPEVDHRDGNLSNNIWKNLREITRMLNQQNQRREQRSNKSTGLLGVKIAGGMIVANINHRGKRIYLGCFDSPQKAHQAYLDKKRRLHKSCTI